MGKKTSGPGWFLVRIEMRGTRAVAVLTGDHFGPDQRAVANAVAGMDGKESVASGGSPVYLVKDSVVGLALAAARMKSALKTADCHAGPRGKPCGTCETCRDARDRLFTRVILGALELPGGDLPKRLRETIRQVVGLAWADAPWSEPMTDEEVERVFEELGVQPANEGE